MTSGSNLLQQAPSQEERVLGLAALFEDDFSFDWLEELTGARASVVLSALEAALDKGWVARKRSAVYSFVDESRREELAGLLSPEELRRRHREIADVLIRELPDEEGSVLRVSRHLLRVPVDLRGCQWLVRAGRVFVASLATARGVACFAHVLSCLSGSHGENEDRLFIEAAMEHSNALAGRGRVDGSVAFLLEARQRAKRIRDRRGEVLLEMHLAKYENLASGFNRALGRFKRALAKAEAIDDPAFLRNATVFHTYFLFWQGRFKDVIDVYERTVPEVDRHPLGQFPLMAAIIVGHCYSMTGQINQGLGMLDAIRSHCLRKKEGYLSSHATTAIAMVLLSMGRVDEAIKYLRKGLKEAEESANRFARSITSLILALAYHETGDARSASRYLRSFRKHCAITGAESVLIPYLLEAAWAERFTGMERVLDRSLDQEIANALRQRNVFVRGLALRFKALMGMREGMPAREMVRLLNLSLSQFASSGNRAELGRTYVELGRLHLSLGDDPRGKATLRTASEILVSVNPELIPDDLRTLIGDTYPGPLILNEILNSRHYIGPDGDGRKVFQWAVTTANRLIGAERAALLFFDDATQPPILNVKASRNLTTEEIEDQGFADSREIILQVAESGKGRFFPASADGGGSRTREPKSRICVPLMLNGRAVGAFYHENRLLDSVFKDWHLDLLAFFATVVVTNLGLRERSGGDGGRQAQERGNVNMATRGEGFLEDGIVGSSPSMRRLLRAVNDVADTDGAVLLLGETGVGKNLIAAAIHRRSRRGDGPFVTVQCSALTESLITSELFGHERGAFTGATDTRIGRFELAHKGTLFLDEVGDLSLEVQARLLRVLQTKEFERVGGGKRTITSDFRLIAATNRNLAEEVRQKRFREDLYYRINVFPLQVPPLRERREDIPTLARHFLILHGIKQEAGPKRLTREALDRLLAHDWPGNVRELENVIQRGLLSSKGNDLQLPRFETVRSAETGVAGLKRLDEVERDHILRVLEAKGGKVRGAGGAAEALGMNPSTLRARMRKLGITKPKR